ncbi:MAG: heterodisulfide reductase-related iron-sulfur binding cluster [Oscillospiraceae bacterium]|nr:heterodisulfide reductase-related iron-sulfur binding cluster [Oscillospiraceae bacterium]
MKDAFFEYQKQREADQANILRLGLLCTQEDPPRCTAACPFHVDARGLCTAAAAGDFNKGRAILEQLLTFPRILTQLCEAPCQKGCILNEIGEPVQICKVADACMRFGEKPRVRRFPKPKRNKTALILGGGLSAMVAAAELGKKGYRAHVLYDGETPAGRLQALVPDVLDQDALDQDFAPLEKMPITFEKSESSALNPESYLDDPQYDSIFVSDELYRVIEARGVCLPSDQRSMQTDRPKIFAGGQGAKKPSFIGEAFNGKRAALSMDRFMQNVAILDGRDAEGPMETRLYTNLDGVVPTKPVAPAAKRYTQEEAKEEAGRCINCQCLECVKGCAFMQHYNSYPKKLINEFHQNLNMTLANRRTNIVIDSCASCGQCKVICPNDCDMKEAAASARRIMVGDHKMPPSHHEFALVDMEFSNGEEFFTVRHQPGHKTSRYVFFPGCQLAASAPDNLRAAYEDLAGRLEGGVGLILGCCGAIAEWVGRNDLFQIEMDKMKTAWEELGRPRVITACPTCYRIFKTFTQMPVTGIWQVYKEIGLPQGARKGSGILTVHDSCGARDYAEIRECVRDIAGELGYQIEEPNFNGETTPCCGFGGLVQFAQREVAGEMAKTAAERCGHTCLTYCANCRDRLGDTQKPTVHLLELLFGKKETGSPGVSLRRKNRLEVRSALLRDLWGEDVFLEKPDFKLVIPDDVKKVLEDRMILESDLITVLSDAEKDNSFILDTKTNHLMASHRIGNVTFWAVVDKLPDGFQLVTAYSYRMTEQEI